MPGDALYRLAAEVACWEVWLAMALNRATPRFPVRVEVYQHRELPTGGQAAVLRYAARIRGCGEAV